MDCMIFFFFFQAEDGIRDKLVTGVQTCALPISLMSHVLRQTLLLAMALEAKGFDPSAIRTRPGESRFTAADDAVLAGLAVLLLLSLWLRWNGYGVVEGGGFWHKVPGERVAVRCQ